jgi:hypothetical protein
LARLFSVEGFSLAVDDLAALFNDDLGRIGLSVAFAHSHWYAPAMRHDAVVS